MYEYPCKFIHAIYLSSKIRYVLGFIWWFTEVAILLRYYNFKNPKKRKVQLSNLIIIIGQYLLLLYVLWTINILVESIIIHTTVLRMYLVHIICPFSWSLCFNILLLNLILLLFKGLNWCALKVCDCIQFIS